MDCPIEPAASLNLNRMTDLEIFKRVPGLLLDEDGWAYTNKVLPGFYYDLGVKDDLLYNDKGLFLHSLDYPDCDSIKDKFGALVHFVRLLVTQRGDPYWDPSPWGDSLLGYACVLVYHQALYSPLEKEKEGLVRHLIKGARERRLLGLCKLLQPE